MKKTHYKIMFRLIKQVFIALLKFSGSLASMANASNFTTCIIVSYQSCVTRPNLVVHLWLN